MKRSSNPGSYALGVTVLVAFLCISETSPKDLGKLDCTEKDGLKPNSKLLNLIVSKCQPKQGQSEKMIASCLMKCLMKQHKAVDKQGKLKMKKAIEVVSIFPDKFKDNCTARFEHCASEHGGNLQKEPNGCDSWLPFTECFYMYGKNMCPNEKDRLAKEAADATSTTETADATSTTEACAE